jgi:hypothetical protein
MAIQQISLYDELRQQTDFRASIDAICTPGQELRPSHPAALLC